jgi:hypothetical protein
MNLLLAIHLLLLHIESPLINKKETLDKVDEPILAGHLNWRPIFHPKVVWDRFETVTLKTKSILGDFQNIFSTK